MVMDANDAAENYEAGIDAIGISAWRDAMKENTVSGAAQILQDARSDNLTKSNMKTNYKNKY